MHRDFFAGLQRGTLLFGRFRLVRCLHATDERGVLLCLDRANLNRRVAVKIVYNRSESGSLFRSMYHRELEFLDRINSRYVIRGEAFFEDDEFTAFSMRYLPGGTLADLIDDTNGLLPLHAATTLLSQVCLGASAIARAGIVHRDMKPDNVLISEEGRATIADFDVSIDENELLPEQNDVKGTVDYLSPEYVQHGRLDHRSDIYALGLVAYELLTKKNPYRGDSAFDSLVLRVGGKALAPHELRGDCPRPLSRAIMKAIHPDPDQRYQHVAELWKDLVASCYRFVSV